MTAIIVVIATLVALGANQLAQAYAPKPPLTNLKYGTVRGITLTTSRTEREYDSYRGIPYAKPPIGNLRFKAPERPESWSFPLDATKEGPYCIQKNYFFADPQVEGQEDCLYLNVYVPKKAKHSRNLLPVMVFIHWGGFFAGRGTSDYLGADYFMEKDVILVTFNYRLGVLGFLSTLDDEAPGNYGLKDQVAALHWVQENIESFGGDRNQVTLFGQSAGAASVHLHMLSPASKGLFARAISESGTALNLWAKPQNLIQTSVTAAQALFVGCDKHIGNSKKLVACLRDVNATDLVATGDLFKYFSIEPITPYTTVIEVRTKANPNPFLTKNPIEYIQNNEFQKVPWIMGATQDEGILRAAPLLRQNNIREALNANLSVLLPQMLGLALSVSPNNTEELMENLQTFYLQGKDSIDINDPTNVQGFIDLYSDRVFIYGIYQSAMLHSAKQHLPIWLYNFAYKGQYTYGDLFAATNTNINFNWGTSHCDDLLYLFTSSSLFPNLKSNTDRCLSDQMVTIWTNFAIHGDPDPSGDLKWNQLQTPSSPLVGIDDFYYLNITGSHQDNSIKLIVQNGFHKDRISFWLNQTVFENNVAL